MKLALTVDGWLDEDVIFAQQMGVNYLLGRVDLRLVLSPNWEGQKLAGLRNRIEKAGLSLAGISAEIGLEDHQGVTRLKKSDGQQAVLRLVKEAGDVGIKLVCIPGSFFHLPKIGDKNRVPGAHGESQNTLPPDLVKLEEIASHGGVKLAIDWVQFVKKARLTENPEILETFTSQTIGWDARPEWLLPVLSAYTHDDQNASLVKLDLTVLDKLYLVTLENSWEQGAKTTLARPDDGVINMVDVCWRLQQAGYKGFIRPGGQPYWVGDNHARQRALSFSIGYLKAVIQSLE
jgi:hypothetical protein